MHSVKEIKRAITTKRIQTGILVCLFVLVVLWFLGYVKPHTYNVIDVRFGELPPVKVQHGTGLLEGLKVWKWFS